MIRKNITFTQGILQDYVDCKMRFYLRYVQGLAWPAIQAEPITEVEQHILRGEQFHRSVHQFFIGIPMDKIQESLVGPQMQRWWETFISFWQREYASYAASSDIQILPEYSFFSQFHGVRLGVKYDLVLLNKDNELIIFDWKTSHRRPYRSWLAGRIQTRLYQFLGLKAGNYLFADNNFSPGQIQLNYWFSDFPEQPENLRYGEDQFKSDEIFFFRIIDEILDSEEANYQMTDEIKSCQFCNYRSYCNRGRVAANYLEEDGEAIIGGKGQDSFDFTDMEEIPLLI